MDALSVNTKAIVEERFYVERIAERDRMILGLIKKIEEMEAELIRMKQKPLEEK